MERKGIVDAKSERAERAARNELLFRAVNEQILQMTERFRAQLSDIDIVCECAVASCVGTIRITAEEFVRIRRETGTFCVLAGHEDTDVGKVLHEVAERIRRRSLVILISDLIDDEEKIAGGLQHFRHNNHEVLVFHTMDDA